MVASMFLLAIATSCTDETADDGSNASDNGGGGNTSFPEKKVKRVVYSSGDIHTLTYDFYWNGNLLDRISCSNQNGVSINKMYFYYDGQGRISKTAFQMYDDDEIIDAYTYSYDANGRLVKQEIQVPLYSNYDPETGEEVYTYMPSTYTFTYTNGNVSKIHSESYEYDDGVYKNEIDYLCTWTDGNLTTIKEIIDDESETFTLQYDDKKNPLRLPMGVEVINPFWSLGNEDINVAGGDYSYMAALFYLAGANVNNCTSLNLETQSFFTRTYTYNSDGYPISGTISHEQPLNFTITYY